MKSEKKDPRIAIYPGSFDPIHNGHVQIIKRAAKLFDTLYVAIAENPAKKHLFAADERLDMLKKIFKNEKNIRPVSFYGLTVDFAKSIHAKVIIRGLRLVSDFESELLLDMHNRQLDPSIETLYMMPSKEFIHFNSSFVKQIVQFDSSRIKNYVPIEVYNELRKRFPTQKLIQK